jgi:predicted TIM-barrel fold metal-dependent hydrolase
MSEGEKMKIDVHGHIGSINLHPNWTANAKQVSEMTQKAGVDHCFVSSAMSIMYDTCKGNDEVLEAVREFDNLWGYMVVNPFFPESFRYLEYIGRERKIVGCKIHPDYHGYDLSSPMGKDLVRRVVDHTSLILFHTSCMAGTGFSRIGTLGELASKYSQATFISAHLAGLYQNPLYPYYINYSGLEEAAQMNLPNLLIDTSSFWIYAYPGVMKRIVELVGPDKLVFGTDIPIQSDMQIRFKIIAIDSLEFPQSDKEKIYSKNIRKSLQILKEFK